MSLREKIAAEAEKFSSQFSSYDGSYPRGEIEKMLMAGAKLVMEELKGLRDFAQDQVNDYDIRSAAAAWGELEITAYDKLAAELGE